LKKIYVWDVLPDFASVNIHEAGALQVAKLLLDRRVGVEAGVWTARAAETLVDSDLAEACLRILIEPAEEPGNARENLARIETTLQGVGPPRLLHGLGASVWEFVRLAAERRYDTRTGFEDTLQLPDGSQARSNAELVIAARRIIAEVNSHR